MIYNPSQTSLEHLTKLQLVKHYFEVESHYSTLRAPSPQRYVRIVGLLWMNQHQHCVGGGEGELDRKTRIFAKF